LFKEHGMKGSVTASVVLLLALTRCGVTQEGDQKKLCKLPVGPYTIAGPAVLETNSKVVELFRDNAGSLDACVTTIVNHGEKNVALLDTDRKVMIAPGESRAYLKRNCDSIALEFQGSGVGRVSWRIDLLPKQ
jgi:hypothetical protein